MAKYFCETCGTEHDELPLDLGYDYPADWFRVPESERAQRVRYDGDLCSIDHHEYYARGILAIPIEGGKEFRWGVWARIAKPDFKRYWDLWDADEAETEPAFPGALSGGVLAYPDTDGLEVDVKLLVRKRPRFFVKDPNHPLAIAQRQGISWMEVHRFIRLAFR